MSKLKLDEEATTQLTEICLSFSQQRDILACAIKSFLMQKKKKKKKKSYFASSYRRLVALYLYCINSIAHIGRQAIQIPQRSQNNNLKHRRRGYPHSLPVKPQRNG
jgi:hypothetical protein